MALSHTTSNIRLYPGPDGAFVPVRIQWNKHTNAWHIHRNIGTLHLRRGTVIPTPAGYLLITKVWDYDPKHPERIAFPKMPLMAHSSHLTLVEAISVFTVNATE